MTVFNEMLKIAPKNEFKALFEPVLLDTRGDGGVNYISVTPMRYSEDRLRGGRRGRGERGARKGG